MNVFNDYAQYYDLLYHDKNYQAESEYVHGLIQAHAPDTCSILNLGCGSGRHDRCLVVLGYSITGVDISKEMLSAAREAAVGDSSLEYIHGDVRRVGLCRQFDAVISLFHVMSYQITNSDLRAAFATASAHLKPGGLFLFDCWYGPGVLSDPPSVRLKEIEDDTISVTRIAEPVLHRDENIVDVNYRVTIKNKSKGEVRDIRETHRMRYLFVPEIMEYIEGAGLQHRFSFRWLDTTAPDDTTWYLCCGAKKCK